MQFIQGSRCILRSGREHGNISLLMLGLLSLLIIVGFGLFRRVGSHTHTVTLLDQSLIVRNVLESFSGDVFQFIRREANHKDSALYQTFRSAPPAGDQNLDLDAAGYAPSTAFTDLIRPWQSGSGIILTVDSRPRVTLTDIRLIPLPGLLYFADATRAVSEYRGTIRVTSSGGFGDRRYTLTAHFPFRVTFVQLPMLREFAWFFDQLHTEQSGTGSSGDGVNVLSIKDDDVEAGNWPLVLDSLFGEKATPTEGGSKTTMEFGTPHLNGKVYLGGSGSPLFLQLAGERQPTRALFSDLSLIKPSHFNIVTDKTDKMYLEDLSVVGFSQQVRGFSKYLGPPISPSSIRTTSWIFGFSDEMSGSGTSGSGTSGSGGGFFAKSLKLEKFLASDPGFAALNATPGQWRLSSALKPLGLSKAPLFYAQAIEQGIPPTEAIGYSIIPARQIFGQVFRRFVMLSFFVVPSCAYGEGEEMIFNDNPGFRLTAKQIRGTQEFDPPAGTTYRDYMSRIVSGDPAKQGEGYSSLIQPYNLRPGGAMGQPLSHQDYQGADGLRVKAESSFDRYREDMLNVQPVSGPGAPITGLQERISRYYPDGESFLIQARGVKALSETSRRFWVGGTVVVDKELDLSGGVREEDIRGGIIIVNGPLKLGDVIPGKTAALFGADHVTDNTFTAKLAESVTKLAPEEMLTFVVLGGHPITLTGKKYVGIHLVSLNDGPTPLTVPADPFFFFGALALSRPEVSRLARQIKRGTAFFYHPLLASERPPLTVDMDTSMSDYDFSMQ